MTEAIDADPDTILTIPHHTTTFVPDRGAHTPIGAVKRRRSDMCGAQVAIPSQVTTLILDEERANVVQRCTPAVGMQLAPMPDEAHLICGQLERRCVIRVDGRQHWRCWR
jgi:hypothetical protein